MYLQNRLTPRTLIRIEQPTLQLSCVHSTEMEAIKYSNDINASRLTSKIHAALSGKKRQTSASMFCTLVINTKFRGLQRGNGGKCFQTIPKTVRNRHGSSSWIRRDTPDRPPIWLLASQYLQSVAIQPRNLQTIRNATFCYTAKRVSGWPGQDLKSRARQVCIQRRCRPGPHESPLLLHLSPSATTYLFICSQTIRPTDRPTDHSSMLRSSTLNDRNIRDHHDH
jgi:hypothetical protein